MAWKVREKQKSQQSNQGDVSGARAKDSVRDGSSQPRQQERTGCEGVRFRSVVNSGTSGKGTVHAREKQRWASTVGSGEASGWSERSQNMETGNE